MKKVFLIFYVCIFAINTSAKIKPLLHFTFDSAYKEIGENRGTTSVDESIFIGDSIVIKDGVINNALYLDGSTYLKLPDNISKGLIDLTISAWINIDEHRPNQPIITLASGTNEYLILTPQRGDNENGVSLVMTNSNTTTDSHTDREERISNTQQTKPLKLNSWHHIAFTLNGSVGKLYVDGELVETKCDFTTNPSLFRNTKDNYIGKPTWPDQYFKGLIDDFRLYDVALSSDEIIEFASMGDSFIVNEDSMNLQLDFITNITSSYIELPKIGNSGSTIEWISMNVDVIESDGTIHRPSSGCGDIEVKLIANISKGDYNKRKEFKAVVKDLKTPLSDLDVFSMNTGNPVIPAYLADASVFYDEKTKRFYAFGTNDGAEGGNVYPAQMWYSDDCANWVNKEIELPKTWTDHAGTVAVWAPSIEYSSVTDKYYLMYSIASNTFIGYSDSPLGPWEDANAISPGNMFYKGYDGQFFVDDDNTIYIETFEK